MSEQDDLKAWVEKSKSDWQEQQNQEYRQEHPEGELYGMSVEDMTESAKRWEYEEWNKEHSSYDDI